MQPSGSLAARLLLTAGVTEVVDTEVVDMEADSTAAGVMEAVIPAVSLLVTAAGTTEGVMAEGTGLVDSVLVDSGSVELVAATVSEAGRADTAAGMAVATDRTTGMG